MARKNFIQLLLNAETNDVEKNEDAYIDYKSVNLSKTLTMDVRNLIN